jgi:hypothetical protein
VRSGSTRAFLAILFVVVTVTLTSLGRSNAAFYAATGNTGNAFTAGSGFGVGSLSEWYPGR